MEIRITLKVEVVHELLSLVGLVTPVHQMSVYKHRLQSVEMTQLILTRCVMMEILTMEMDEVRHELLSQAGHVTLAHQTYVQLHQILHEVME